MKDKLGRLGACRLFATMVWVFSLLATSTVSIAAESSATKSAVHMKPGEVFHCEKNKKLLVDSYAVPAPHRYRSVTAVYECDNDQQVIELIYKTGRSVELDRFRAVDGAKIEVKLLEAVGNDPMDVVIMTYGFEPAGDDQVFLVEVYRLDVSKKTFSIWSSLPPRIEDLNGDGIQEMVVYEDLFSINRPDAPNWPRVFELSPWIKAVSLSKFRPLLVDLRKKSVASVERITKTCQAIGSTPCPLESSIAGLKNQLETIDALGHAGK